VTVDEIKTLMVDDKWLATIAATVQGELDRVSQTLTGYIRQLAERYMGVLIDQPNWDFEFRPAFAVKVLKRSNAETESCGMWLICLMFNHGYDCRIMSKKQFSFGRVHRIRRDQRAFLFHFTG
jgi:hypothetical protein